jgi:hypothetical protein
MAKTYEFHEVANIFPLIEGKEFSDLVEDVKKNGLYESIWLHEGKIIDGRNRYRACLQAGVEPRFKNWDEKGTLVDFVMSENMARRHLDEAQRVIVHLNKEAYLAKIAKEKQGEYAFSSPPVLFYLDDLFIKRICRHPTFEVRQLHTDGLYGTLIKRVPKEYLLNFRDEMWWKEKEGSQNKLWMY